MRTETVLPQINALVQRGDYTAAKRRLREALEISPDFFLYYETLGDIHAGEGNGPSAGAAYRYALRLNPGADWIRAKLAAL